MNRFIIQAYNSPSPDSVFDVESSLSKEKAFVKAGWFMCGVAHHVTIKDTKAEVGDINLWEVGYNEGLQITQLGRRE